MPTVLDVLDRPKELKKQDAEFQRRKAREGSFPVRNAKWLLLIFANIVVFVFDVLAVSTVYAMTRDWVLSALALLPTGIPIVLWEIGWLYPLASRQQKHNAEIGIGVGAGSALFVGVLAVLVVLFPVWQSALAAILLIGCVLFVLVHAALAAMFFYTDPIIRREHELQKTLSEQKFQEDTVREAETLLKAVENILQAETNLRKAYGGKEVDRALGLLFGLEEKTGVDINKDGFIGKPSQPNRNNGNRPVPVADFPNHLGGDDTDFFPQV